MPKMIPAGRRYTYGDIRRYTCADVSSDIRRDGGGDRFVSNADNNCFVLFYFITKPLLNKAIFFG